MCKYELMFKMLFIHAIYFAILIVSFPIIQYGNGKYYFHMIIGSRIKNARTYNYTHKKYRCIWKNI